jgi:long-chain acyl-CoA synthetase
MAELNFGQILRRGHLFADRPALRDLGNGYQATYGEHLERVGRLASVIAGLGVARSDSVAVLAGSSHVYVELWRACCAGAAVINPLNSRLAPDELVYILNDAGSEVIFVDPEHAPVVAQIREQLPSLRSVVLIGDGDVPHDHRLEDLMVAAASSELPGVPAPDGTAVLMYTGGTTGLPKGVVLSQRALALSIYRMQSVVSLGPNQSFLSFMPMFQGR